MRRIKVIVAALLAVLLAGCVLRGKPASSTNATPPKPVAAPAASTPAPPPSLSIPQTRAQLPPPQPVPPEALVTASAAAEEDPLPQAPPVTLPKPPPAKPPRPVSGAARTETPGVQPAPDTGRRPVQEVLPPDEQTRLREEANNARRDVRQRIAKLTARAQSQQRDRIARIQTFVNQSEDYERRGDLKMASELASRALILAKELR